MHQKAVMAWKPMVTPKVPPIYQHLTKMDEETQKRMCRPFDWAYMVAYAELPFTNFEQFINVEKKHGVNLSTTYINDKSCRTLIDAIGDTMLDDLKSLFESDDEPFYFSILFDGSSDKALSEKEDISIKLIEHGLLKIKLLG